MSSNAFLHKFAVLIGVVMILAGTVLGVLAYNQLPTLPGVKNSALAAVLDSPDTPSPQPDSPLSPNGRSTAQPAVANVAESLGIALGEGLPTALISATTDLVLNHTEMLITDQDSPQAQILFDWEAAEGEPFYRQFFAAATRFDTIDLSLRNLHIERAWRGDTRRFKSIAVLATTLPALTQFMGEAGDSVVVYDEMDALIAATWADRNILALVPFEQLRPSLAVYTVDGQTPVENATKFNPSAYPLVATVYAHTQPGAPSNALSRLSAALPDTNRDSSRLTVVAMTGVTAMVRLTADQMDRRGAAWPAEVVGPELAAADITAISNEVPFVPDCETNTDEDNLVFCSKPEYMETLTASGADIIGLTGNHQNDYGLEDALTSLTIYEDAGLPVYGGGADRADAFAPLFLEHNGNKLAFLGANSYGPPSAWATEFSPGSAPFDLAIMSAAIRSIKDAGEADVVFSELQYQESYAVTPLYDQRLDFGALARAGADIVTGVQSHVPQAVEFVDGHLVLYGLGNLYFDQMWTEDTREGLIVKHTIYAGRHISTQLLPTLLYDYGQPRWPDAERKAAILAKVFGASVWE
ncbi:MAG: CapA family protein [Caldilineaceae bacterium]|nr:CapA family protein [Caldilineaceae bacterium]